MADLKTNYKDDVLDTSKNEKRKFRMIQNDDGTVSFDDATEYTQQGDAFGAADINATNAKINEQNQSLTNKIVGIEINKNIVTNNYSYAHLKSGIGILNIDIIVESVPSNAEIDILYTGFRPTMNLYINTVNSDGNHITIHINTNGIVQLYSNTPGKFGIRTQFIIV